jgi:hypothetical protein
MTVLTGFCNHQLTGTALQQVLRINRLNINSFMPVPGRWISFRQY